MPRLAFGLALFAITLLLVIIRPRRISEAIFALGGGALMIAGGFVAPAQAWMILLGEWNVYGFFLGLMTIAAIAEQAGIFEALALLAARWARGDARRLYLAVFLVGMGIAAFLSNDATALILTPVVYALVTRLRLRALPFMFACTFIADTASFLLPVSNPINIIVLSAFGGGLGEFLRYLLLPAAFCIAFNIAIFFWLFRRDLRYSYDISRLEAIPAARGFFRFTIIALSIICVGYVAGSLAQIPLSFISLGGSALLLAGAQFYHKLDPRRLGSDISWSLFGFITGLFILVRGIENLGVTAALGQGLVRIASVGALPAVLATAFGTAIGANIINNVPMALVMVSTLRGTAASAGIHQGLIYATIFGADLGPNLTTIGSLATMLWLLILRRKGLDISTMEYIKLGITIVPVMLLAGALLIWLRL